MTLFGKVTIVNTLVNSLFIHRLMALPMPPKTFFEQYRIMVTQFVWNGKTPRIRYNRLIQDYRHLGIKLVDLQTKTIALKVAWPARWADRDPTELAWFYYGLPIKDPRIWECNLCPRDVKKISESATLATF